MVAHRSGPLAPTAPQDGGPVRYRPVVDLGTRPAEESPGDLVGFTTEGSWPAPSAAVDLGLRAPLALFVEDRAIPGGALSRSAPADLQVVVELPGRAVGRDPVAALLTVGRLRRLGWRVALGGLGGGDSDDDDCALAVLPVLDPDVVALAPAMVARRPDARTAEVMHVVNAFAETSGALVLADGVDTPAQLGRALSLGARLGRGRVFGEPAAVPVVPPAPEGLDLSRPALPAPRTPFDALPMSFPLRRTTKRLLYQLTRHLEREVTRLGADSLVLATFQTAEHFDAATAARYRELSRTSGYVGVLGVGMPDDPAPGVHGTGFDADDPLALEWSLVVLGRHFSAAVLARQVSVGGVGVGDGGVGDGGVGDGVVGLEADRAFEFALTYDRPTVVRAARSLLTQGEVPAPDTDLPTAPPDLPPDLLPTGSEDLLRRALSATSSGVTIADVRHPDQPLVFVNSAFERLSGLPAAEVLGRNCRFLQSAETDPAAIARIRAAIRAGEEAHEVLLNVRGPTRRPWWNEVRLAPIRRDGVVVQYVGVQSDVTGQVETERELRRERDRARSYADLIELHGRTDQLTGLLNRRTLEAEIETLLATQSEEGTSTALLFCDVDGFKQVNDTLGHVAGDDVLAEVGRRLQAAVRPQDLVARFGGDEFVVVLPLLRPTHADEAANLTAAHLRAAVTRTALVPAEVGTLDLSIGVSVSPADGTDFRGLLHRADGRMYIAKARARARRGAPGGS